MADAGNLLVRAGLLAVDALARARESKAEMGGTLAEHIVLAQAMEDDDLTQFFRERLMVPRVSESRLRELSKRIISKVPRDMAAELRVIPVSLDRESSLTVAMSDPSDTHALDELEFFTEHYVVRAVASQRQIAWCLAHYYDVVTPLFEGASAGAKFENAKTEPFGRADDAPKRPGRVTNAVAAARHHVKPPATIPPTPLEATLADLEATTIESHGSDTIREPAPLRAPRAERMSEADVYEGVVILDADEPEDDEGGLEQGFGGDFGSDFGSDPGSDLDDPDSGDDGEDVVELDLDAIELLADAQDEHPGLELVLDDDEQTAERPATLEDGSPAELAPRVGEVLVNTGRRRDLSAAPAVVLDDSLFMLDAQPAAAEAETSPDAHAAVEDDDEITSPGWVDGVVTETMERGTDSAPFLLSEIKAAAEAADAERERREEADAKPVLETEPVDEADLDEDEAVVLLEVPKRPKRRTSIGHGAPRANAASVLNLRTGRKTDVEALAAVAERVRGSEPPPSETADGTPIIVDDQEHSEPLLELASDEATAKTPPPRERTIDSTPPPREPELDSHDASRLLDALEGLAAATKRDEIVAALLDYLEHYCDRVVFLAVRSGALKPWQLRSAHPAQPTEASLPLRELSLFRDVVDTRLPYRGPVTDDASRSLLESVFGGVEHEGLAVPVAVRGRVVGLLFGEGVADDLSGDNIAVVTQAVGRALERSLRSNPRMT